MVVETTRRNKGKRVRFGLALASVALLPWGAAAFMLGASAQPAQAVTQVRFQDHDVFLRVEREGQVSFVRIDMFVGDDGSGAVDQAGLDAAKAEIIARLRDICAAMHTMTRRPCVSMCQFQAYRHAHNPLI